MSTSRYRMFAEYNRWANRRLYDAVARLPDADYRADRGAFFRSIHGTLNHLVVADSVWWKRFTGEGDAPDRLDAIVCDTLPELDDARRALDERIIRYCEGLSDADLAGVFRYRRVSDPSQEFVQPLMPALDHAFNHQTHHRGQAHCLITGLGGQAPELDLLFFQRESGWGTTKPIA